MGVGVSSLLTSPVGLILNCEVASWFWKGRRDEGHRREGNIAQASSYSSLILTVSLYYLLFSGQIGSICQQERKILSVCRVSVSIYFEMSGLLLANSVF